jgi:chemotaxis protein CheD
MTPEHVYLHPGEMFSSSETCVVTTVLGSCVAVCLWDSLLRQGGVNHFLLPFQAGKSPPSPRFGDGAIPILIGKLLDLGSKKENIEAKIFGGACVIHAMQEGGREHLGTKNVEVAKKILESEKILIVKEDVGGLRGRKLIYQIHSGVAWVKLL